ncbi:MAG TPA: M28 family peptidase [Chitinophagaceae bacterium]
MRKLFTVVLAIGTFSAMAQKGPETYAKTITAADLRQHLYIVAGAEMQGRETATEGQRKAAAYIETQFKRIGLQPGNNGSFQQPYPLYQDSLVAAGMEVNGQKFTLDKDFNTNLANTPALQAFSEAVFIGPSVTADAIKAVNLSGKLVVIAGESGARGRGVVAPRMDAIRGGGAAAVLTVSANYPRREPAERKGRLGLSFFKPLIGAQQFTVSEGVAKAIVGTANAAGGSGYESVKSAITPTVVKAEVLLNVEKATRTLQSTNVVGVLPGTDLKDEYLVITAHYDHEGSRGDSVIFYGADDDGSGTVSVIELAEAFAKAKAAGKGPRRSIVFMTVSGEEKGLLGSAYYGDHPLFPLEKTTANLNIDMIGRIDPKRTVGDSTNYVYVVGDDKLSSDLRPISEAVNKKFTRLELDYKYNAPDDKEFIYYRSDHYNFAKNGVPIIFYFNGTHADYHRPTDTPDKINYPLMEKRARLVFHTAWEMANRQEMLKRDRPLPPLARN